MPKKIEKDTDVSIYSKLGDVINDIGKIEKNADNPFHGNKYITLDKILDTIQPILQKHNCLITQMPLDIGVVRTSFISLDSKDNAIYFDTHIANATKKEINKDGIQTEKSLSPQEIGSAITYGRRYGISALLRIVADEDDDGNKASGIKVAKKEYTKKTYKPKSSSDAKYKEILKLFTDKLPSATTAQIKGYRTRLDELHESTEVSTDEYNTLDNILASYEK